MLPRVFHVLLLVALALLGSQRLRADAVDVAVAQLGKPYVWGGSGPEQYDCSGLTRYAFEQIGTTLPRTAQDQSQTGDLVTGPLQRGDLLFFATVDGRPGVVTHVGVYAGQNNMIDANSYAGRVTQDDITIAYWSSRLLFARRPGGPSVTFMKALGSTGDDYASSIQRTADGGFIVAGYTSGIGAGGQDVLLVKLDGSGVIQWAKTAGTAGSDVASSVRQTSDGGYIVSGSTDGVTGVAQFLVSRFDGSGSFQWATSLGNPSDSAAGLSVQQTVDGGFVATGFPGGALGGLGLLKYDSTGQLQWLRRAVGTNVYGNSVQQTSDGGYVVAGSKQIAAQYDLTLLKFDGSGSLQWAQLAGGSGNESGNAVQQTSDGGYIVAGATASSGAGGQDVLLLKYDGSGALQWARTAGSSGDDEADSVQQTSGGGYIVSGRTASFGVGQNTLLLKYDGSGTLLWARAGGGSTSGSSVRQTSDGGYVVAGSTASFGAGGSDILLIRTDANGNIAGCTNWSSVTPSIGTTFASAATSYSVDSPSFSVGAPLLTVANATLTPNTKCP